VRDPSKTELETQAEVGLVERVEEAQTDAPIMAMQSARDAASGDAAAQRAGWRPSESGEPLSVALTVDGRCHGLLPSTLFGDELWPGESALVRFEIAPHVRRPVRLAGLGDFSKERRSAR
jgi:hypothetical protein